MPLEIKKDEVINSVWAELQANMQGLMARRDRAKAIFAENEFSDQDFEDGVLKKGTGKGTRGPIHDADEADKAIKAESEADIINRTHTLETLLKTLHSVTDERQLASLNSGMQQYGKPATWWRQLKDKRANVVTKQEELERAMYSSDDSLNPWDHVPSKYFKDVDKKKSKQEQKAEARVKWINAAKQALVTAEADTLETRNAFFSKVQSESFGHLLRAEENLVAANKRLATLHSTPAEIAQTQHLVGAQISSGATVLLLNLAANARAAMIDLMLENKRAELEVLNKQQKDLARQNDRTILLKKIRTPKAKTTQAQIELKSVIDALEKLKAGELRANALVINDELKAKIRESIESKRLYDALQGGFAPANLPHVKPKTREQRQENNQVLANAAREYSAIIADQVPASISEMVSDQDAAIKRAAGDAFIGSLASRSKKYRGERDAKVGHTERAYKGQSRASAATVTAEGANIVNLDVMLYAKDFRTENQNNFPQALSYLYTELFIKRTDIGTIREVNDPKEGKYYIVQLKEKNDAGEITDQGLVNERTFVLRSTDEPVTLTDKSGRKVKKSISTLSEVLVAALASTNSKTFNLPNSRNASTQVSDNKSVNKPSNQSIAEQCTAFLTRFAGPRLEGSQPNGVKVLMERLSSEAPDVSAAVVNMPPRQNSYTQQPQQPLVAETRIQRPRVASEEEQDAATTPRQTVAAQPQRPVPAKAPSKRAEGLLSLDKRASDELEIGFENFCRAKFFNGGAYQETAETKALWENLNKKNMIDALAKFMNDNPTYSREEIFYSAASVARIFEEKGFIERVSASSPEGKKYYDDYLNATIARDKKRAAKAATKKTTAAELPDRPARKSPAATAENPKAGLLGSIGTFNKDGLKKAKTNDRSAPAIEKNPATGAKPLVTPPQQERPVPPPRTTTPLTTAAAPRVPPPRPATQPPVPPRVPPAKVVGAQTTKRAFEGPESFTAQRSAPLISAGGGGRQDGEFAASPRATQLQTPPPLPPARKVPVQPPAPPPRAPVLATPAPVVNETGIDLSKYQKMQKAGLPQGAVEHAMRKDNIDTKLLFPDAAAAATTRSEPQPSLETGNKPAITHAASAKAKDANLLSAISGFNPSTLKKAETKSDTDEITRPKSAVNPMLDGIGGFDRNKLKKAETAPSPVARSDGKVTGFNTDLVDRLKVQREAMAGKDEEEEQVGGRPKSGAIKSAIRAFEEAKADQDDWPEEFSKAKADLAELLEKQWPDSLKGEKEKYQKLLNSGNSPRHSLDL